MEGQLAQLTTWVQATRAQRGLEGAPVGLSLPDYSTPGQASKLDDFKPSFADNSTSVVDNTPNRV